jgi:hypothetical protein
MSCSARAAPARRHCIRVGWFTGMSPAIRQPLNPLDDDAGQLRHQHPEPLKITPRT